MGERRGRVVTRSVMVQTLCVPCACRCRYCLLSWDGRPIGADYARSLRFAQALQAWLRRDRPEVTFHFSFGYSMEHPDLIGAVKALQAMGSITGRLLQCDGMAFREGKDLEDFLRLLKAQGVERLNFTFYGMGTYHDRFAGRKRDFAHLSMMLEAAARLDIPVSAGVPITKENLDQMESLLPFLVAKGAKDLRLFIPHGEGRGANLEKIRVGLKEFEGLPMPVQKKLNRKVYKTEEEWCKIKGGAEEENRALIISLTEANIDRLEAMSFAQIIAEIEELDESYYGAFPTFDALLERYGNIESDLLYSHRDLFHRCRRQFAAEHGMRLYDVTDERQSGSRRY